jgi:hypothetical protein
VRGPYAIAQRVLEVAGYEITGQAVSRYLYGEIWPKPPFIAAFADTLNLSTKERDSLAWLYSYGVHPNGNREVFDDPP